MLEAELSKLGWQGKIFKPHKIVALLAAIELLKRKDFNDNKIYYSDAFKKVFTDIFTIHVKKKYSCRPYTPFFHLKTSSFWDLIPKKGKEKEFDQTTSVGGPGALMEVVDHAQISDQLIESLKKSDFREEVISSLILSLEKGQNLPLNTASEPNDLLTQTQISGCDQLHNNPFVGYLNSLQQVGGSNENALAESQVCNEYFSLLHVAHPMVQAILDELQAPSGRHVILTGHAGDGKSTLAIDVIKHMRGIPPEAPLPGPIGPREEIASSNVSIIKDLSEQDHAKKSELINELIENKNRFLLVSNTGTLLDLFKSHEDILTPEDSHLESSVLEAISNETGGADLDLKGIRFKIFNLARMDNLALARKIFQRMLAKERWTACREKECSATCPICVNVDLILKNKERVLNRIFLAYRRMYEYGTRLTLRQLTEHLAYILTSGLEGSDIRKMQEKAHRPLAIEFLFFNRFFGDNGAEADMAAIRMKSVKAVLEQGFGERPSPVWEHRLWLKTYGQAFPFNAAGCSKVFDTLRDQGSRIQGRPSIPISPDRAREQVRRMLYFLYDFNDKDQAYICQFLNSPSLLSWMDWQQPESGLKPREATGFGQKVYHVLQEHFTGVRLPEGASRGGDRRLYITLSRPRREVRQSAQIVLAQLDWSTAIHLELKEKTFANGLRRKDLVLRGREPIRDIDLDLGVPFLDYVVMRHFGEFGEVLQAVYIERLDQYKARLQRRIGMDKSQRIMLVHLKTDHTFLRQQYSVTNGTLEVNDVL